MGQTPVVTPIDTLTHSEVLLWAFKKVKRHYRIAEGLLDFAELAGFELNLERELKSIGRDFKSRAYKLRPLKLSPVAKEWDRTSQQYTARQYFQVSVRDQVAWAAMATVVGPELDAIMPAWSYGHRLFRPAWFEEDPNVRSKKFNLGPYRHAHGQLYRPFRASWPLFRRHALLAARLAIERSIVEEQLDEGDLRAYRLAQLDTHSLPFLNFHFWANKPKSAFHASIDLEKFYPSVHREQIIQTVEAASWIRNDHTCMAAFRALLDFQVDVSDCPPRLLPELGCSDGAYFGIPTGLMVAGLLSNIAMLPIDTWAAKEAKKRSIAHLRFVDDHSFIATSFDGLVEWIDLYRAKLSKFDLKIKDKKTIPSELNDYLQSRTTNTVEAKHELARTKCSIDIASPNRLLTATLARVSQLAAGGFQLLTDGEQQDRISEIQFLLRADIPESEIRSDTRLSFSAGLLNRLVPHIKSKTLEIADLRRLASENRRKLVEEKGRGLGLRSDQARSLRKRDRELRIQIKKKEIEADRRLKSVFERLNSDLIAAVHQHPQKARLWTHLLRYYRITGLKEAGHLSVLVNRACPDDDFRQYVSAVLLQVLSALIVEAGAIASRDSAAPERRDSSVDFLVHVLRPRQISTLVRWAEGLFERCTLPLFGAAVLCAANMLQHSTHARAQEVSKRLRSNATVRSIARRFVRALWSPAMAFWVVDRSGSLGSDYDAGLWRHLLDKTIASNEASRRLIRLAPPECVDGRHLQESHIYSRTLPGTLNAYDGGWLLQLRESGGREPMAREPWEVLPPRSRALSPQIKRDQSLYRWLGQQRVKSDNHQLDIFDPRISEWSALEIVRQAANKAINIPADEIHPHNIILEDPWWDLNARYSTWSDWQKTAESSVVFSPSASRLKDGRLLAGLGSISPTSPLLRIHAFAITLLGLLRRSFDWPPRWNLPGQEVSRGSLLIRETLAYPVSSTTTRLLEGALLPRMIETTFLRQHNKISIFEESSDDTFYEATPVVAIDAFLKLLKKSQADLSKGQIAIAGNHLRQLVPIDLMHFAAILGDHDNPPEE